MDANSELKVYWLLELFMPHDGVTLGYYHTGFRDIGGYSKTTKNPEEAKKYDSKRQAENAAARLYSKIGVWRAIEQGFYENSPAVPEKDALVWMRSQAKALGLEGAEDETPFFLARFLETKFAVSDNSKNSVEVTDSCKKLAEAIERALGWRDLSHDRELWEILETAVGILNSTTSTEPVEVEKSGAVAWRFWIDDPDSCFKPHWSGWSTDKGFKDLCERAGHRVEYAYPGNTLAHDGGGEFEICVECGQPTMHMGNICFTCTKAALKAALTPAAPQGGKLLPAIAYAKGEDNKNENYIVCTPEFYSKYARTLNNDNHSEPCGDCGEEYLECDCGVVDFTDIEANIDDETPAASTEEIKWKVGEFRSSHTPTLVVRLIAEGDQDIAEYEKHHSFIRWIYSSIAENENNNAISSK